MSAKSRYRSFLKHRNGKSITNHGFAECVAVANHYNEYVMGQPFVPIRAAYQWWTSYHVLPSLHRYFKRSSTPVVGSLAVWGSSWGGGWGHIGVVYALGKNGTFHCMEQNVGSGAQRWVWRYHRNNDSAVLGFLVPYKNPAKSRKPKPKPSSTQRITRTTVNRRASPSSGSSLKQPALKPNTPANFTGWKYGQTVAGNNVWFQGISGDWFWSGGFKSRSTSGMKNLNPKAGKEVAATYHRSNRQKRKLGPKKTLWLTHRSGKYKGKKQNCVGVPGRYILTGHVYGDKFAEGDNIEVIYAWYKGGKYSHHYIDRSHADKHGMIRMNPTFQRSVGSGYAVHMKVYAGAYNKKTGIISVCDSDATAFSE